MRKPHGFYCYDGAWSRYGEGPYPDVLPPEGNVGERCPLRFPATPLHIMAPAEPPRFSLEAVVLAGHPDVEDPEAWMIEQAARPQADEPARHEPLPGQTSFLDALEAEPRAGTPDLWGSKGRKRKSWNPNQAFLFLEAEA